jgi:hypothetical protein
MSIRFFSDFFLSGIAEIIHLRVYGHTTEIVLSEGKAIGILDRLFPVHPPET